MAEKEPGFEESMKRLEQIVGALEKGDVTLSDSMTLFAEGTELIRRCTALLDNAEQQVIRLKKGPDGAPIEQPFDLEES